MNETTRPNFLGDSTMSTQLYSSCWLLPKYLPLSQKGHSWTVCHELLLASPHNAGPDRNFNSAHPGGYSRSSCSVQDSGSSVNPRTNKQGGWTKFNFSLLSLINVPLLSSEKPMWPREVISEVIVSNIQ